MGNELSENTKKPRYTHYSKPYQKVGDIPEEALKEVKALFRCLSDGVPGIGSFGTSGFHTMPSGSVGCDLRLFVLRMEHHGKAQEMVRKIAEKYDIPWLTHELLEKEPEDNQFIISPDGELHAIIW